MTKTKKITFISIIVFLSIMERVIEFITNIQIPDVIGEILWVVMFFVCIFLFIDIYKDAKKEKIKKLAEIEEKLCLLRRQTGRCPLIGGVRLCTDPLSTCCKKNECCNHVDNCSSDCNQVSDSTNLFSK